MVAYSLEPSCGFSHFLANGSILTCICYCWSVWDSVLDRGTGRTKIAPFISFCMVMRATSHDPRKVEASSGPGHGRVWLDRVMKKENEAED